MLVNHTIAIVIPIVALILIIALFAFIWKKMKKKAVAGGTVGFFVGIIVCIFLFVSPSNVYVVTGDQELSKFVCYGSSEYTTSGGTVVTIDVPMANCTIINDSDEELVLEHVIYGVGFQEDNYLAIGDVLDIDDPSVDYFFNDVPPETIEISGSGSYAVRLWLRSLEDYNADYGDYEDYEDYEEYE